MRIRFIPALLVLVPALAGASVTTTGSLRDARLVQHESRFERASLRAAEFKDVVHTSRSRCSQTTPPEALATPNPLLSDVDRGTRITISFIVGADGHTHSPLILESAGSAPDHTVLRTVRSWRFRPAMCNGVPTEFEGKIQFSSK